jgi:hypothetical protein
MNMASFYAHAWDVEKCTHKNKRVYSVTRRQAMRRARLGETLYAPNAKFCIDGRYPFVPLSCCSISRDRIILLQKQVQNARIKYGN